MINFGQIKSIAHIYASYWMYEGLIELAVSFAVEASKIYPIE